MGPARKLCNEALGHYDVCYASEFRARRGGYSHILLTGQESLDQVKPGYSLTTQRGYVFKHDDQYMTCTFWPQDACDVVDFESDEEEVDLDADNSNKDDAPTRRSNYRFWFLQDAAKLLRSPADAPVLPYQYLPPELMARVLNVSGRRIFFDIETHPNTNSLTCFSVAVNDGPVFTTLIYDYNGRLVAGAHKCLVALARAFRNNTVVVHNTGFDILFLAIYYGIPAPRQLEDTMLMGHRLWPEAEKSLAHNISLHLNAPYHKDTGGTWDPRTLDEQTRLLKYNSLDVVRLRQLWTAQWAAAEALPGLKESLTQVNSSIYWYLYSSFHGLPLDPGTVLRHKRAQVPIMAAMERIFGIMTGIKNINLASSEQLARYFVEGMKYPILKLTDGGQACTDESTLYKYLSKFRNAAIRVILRHKRAKKLTGLLNFQPFERVTKR